MQIILRGPAAGYEAEHTARLFFPDAEKAKRHQERWTEIRRQHREERLEQAEEAQEEVTGDAKANA